MTGLKRVAAIVYGAFRSPTQPGGADESDAVEFRGQRPQLVD